MRLRRTLTSILLLLFLFQIPHLGSSEDTSVGYVDEILEHRSDFFFIRNNGQMDERIEFYSRNDAFKILILKNGMIINQVRNSNGDCLIGSNIEILFRNSICEKIEGNLPLNESLGFSTGNKIIHAKSYEEIILENLWYDIDLIFYYDQDSLLFKLNLFPGSDPEDVKFQVSDNSNTIIENGIIHIYNEVNNISITPPTTYYKETKKIINSYYLEKKENEISMELETYDNSKEVIIDPIINSTFLGGTSFDSNSKIIHEGNRIYVIGNTSSINFPTTPGVYQISRNDHSDIFISVFNESLSNLISSTYIGGNGWDHVDDILIIDENITIFGFTRSEDFPITSGAYQGNKKDGSDCFLTILDLNCSKIKYSSFCGGNDEDRSVSMVYHDSRYYISGTTESWDYPTTENSFNRTYINNSFRYEMMFITSFSHEFELVDSTFIGGYRHDKLSDISIIDDNIFFIGYSNSDDFPITSINYSSTRTGSYDVVFGSINLSLDIMIFSSFFGGIQSDYPEKIYLSEGNMVFTGYTYSYDFPTTTNALDRGYNGNGDSFLTIFGLDDTSRLLYSSYIGGGDFDGGFDIIDTEDSYIIAGKTESSDFPLDGFILDNSHNGNDDGFVIVQNKINYSISYSSFIGGSFDDEIICLGLTGSDVICSGNTYSNNFPVSSGFDTSYNGFNDVFVLRLNLSVPPGKPRITDFHWGDQFINFSWAPGPFDGGVEIIKYKIYRSENNLTWSLVSTTSNIYHNGSNLTNGVKYFYKIKSVNIAGESHFSNVISSTPKTVPQPPIISEITEMNLMINISWDNPISDGGSEITRFRLYRGTNIDDISFYKEIPESSSFYIDESIELGIDYYYQITSINEIGESNRSLFKQYRVTDYPEPPELLGTTSGDNYINISWNEPDYDGGLSIIGYRIYKGSDKGNEIFLSTTENLFFNDTQTSNGNEYFYEISSLNRKGESIEKMAANGTPSRKPDAPFDLSVVFDNPSTSINLIWTEPFDGGLTIDEYLIFKRIGDDGWEMIERIGGHITHYFDTEISLGIMYGYKIIARNGNGNSLPSEVELIKVILPPDPVRLEIVQSGTDYIELSWTLPESNGGDENYRFHLFRGIDGDSIGIYRILDSDIQLFNDTDLEAGNEYYYHIMVVNERYKSTESNRVNKLILDAPDPVNDYMGSSGNGWIQISWRLPEYLGGSDDILVRILRNSSSGWSIVDSDVEDGNFNDTNVIIGVEYSYIIQIENVVGLSNSEMISMIPLGPPMSIRNLSVNMEGSMVKITWDPPASNGGSTIQEYKIYRSKDGEKFELIRRIREIEHSHFDEIQDEGNYSYKIEAINEFGLSESGTVFIVVEGENGDRDNHVLKYVIIITIITIILIISLLVFFLRIRGRNNNHQTEETET